MKCAALLFILTTLAVRADVSLPDIFSDHMVLQADTAVPVWGWAESGEDVSVSIGETSKSTRAGADGKWSVTFEKLKATGTPLTLAVRGHNNLLVQDVLVGEAWLASGQSNMEMEIKGKRHGSVDHADEEIAAAHYPQIRMFIPERSFDIYEVRGTRESPQTRCAGHWQVCSPDTAAQFSAMGYFFARELHRELHAPVGIILAAVGGTPIEAWTSMEAQSANPELKPLLEDWLKQLAHDDVQARYAAFQEAKKAWLKQRSAAQAAGQPIPKAPTPFKNLQVLKPAGLFNELIAPLIPYAVRGVIWYQGERNAAGPFTDLYGKQLSTFIQDWRQRWGYEMYFSWVQLPRFKSEQKAPVEPNGWGVSVRDEMRRTLRLPHTAMAITIDMGGGTAGHPTNKADYAHRLALLALHDVYQKLIAEASGPLFRSAKIEGGKMILSFDHAAGLKAASDELRGFAIAGEDRKFVWAKSHVEGETVVVSSEIVTVPAAVRYGWAANPIGNLINAAGLPASPFRTDAWQDRH